MIDNPEFDITLVGGRLDGIVMTVGEDLLSGTEYFESPIDDWHIVSQHGEGCILRFLVGDITSTAWALHEYVADTRSDRVEGNGVSFYAKYRYTRPVMVSNGTATTLEVIDRIKKGL